MQQTWTGLRAWQRAAGSRFDTYTTAKSVLNTDALAPFNVAELYVGKLIRVKALMAISNIVTAQPTFTFQIMWSNSSVVAWSSGAIATNQASHVSIPAELEVVLRVDSVGPTTSAKFLGIGSLKGAMWCTGGAVTDGSYGSCVMVPATSPAVGTGFDSTVAAYLDFWVGIQTSNGLNGVQVYNYSVEDLN